MRVSLLILFAALACGGTAEAQISLSRDMLSQLKQVTVFVRASRGAIKGSGSGFLFESQRQTGYVVTNAHVISSEKRRASQVEVVFQSGSADEFTLTAAILGIDQQRDLAVLEVKSDRLPRVIASRKRPELRETLPVFILGFPFGEALSVSSGNPAITVSQGSISSLRRDKYGRLIALQIDGSINPGNSGGPVVTPDGELIGIAVAQIRGAHVGIAIPEEQLRQMLRGNIDSSQIRFTTNGATIEVTGSLADPKRQIKRVLLFVGVEPGLQYPMEPDSQGEYPLANRKMTEHDVAIDKDKFQGSVTVKNEGESPPEFLCQLAFERLGGEMVYLKPEVLQTPSPASRGSPAEAIAEPAAPPKPMGSTPAPQPLAASGEPSISSRPGATAMPVDGGSGADARNETKKNTDPDNPFKRLPPTPETVARVLASPPFKVGDADVVKIDLNVERLTVPLAWSADATSLFVLGTNGRVHMLKLPEFRETAAIELGGRCSSLGTSSQGLVVGQESQDRIVVLDETTLAVKREITVGSFQRVVCAPASSRACTFNWAVIQAVDLATGVAEPSVNVCKLNTGTPGVTAGQPPVESAKVPDLPALAMLAMTPDGQYLIGSTLSGELVRFKFGTGPIVAEEKGPKLSGPPTSIEISGDSAYVALGSERGNSELPGDSHEPNSIYVFPISQLSTPKLRIVSGPFPHCLGFDKVGEKIYAQNHGKQLLVYSAQGEKMADYNFGQECGDTRQLFVHPGGNKLCLQTRMHLFFVQLPQ